MSSLPSHNHSDFLSSNHSPFKKHQIMQEYKQSQKQRSILKSKLNILQSQYLKNQRKAKSIESSLKKINKIKETYRRDKESIQYLLRKNKEQQDQKIDQIKIKKEQSRGKLPIIKNQLEKQKSQDYLLVKKKSQDMEKKIKIFKNNIISQRKKTASRIKDEEKMVSLNKTLYMQDRLKISRKKEELQSLKIQRKLKRNRLQLEQMKNLEDSLLEKLDRSRSKLNMSLSKMSFNLRS